MTPEQRRHIFDFGAAGIRSTIRHCDHAGTAHAGTGLDLEEAREPAYLETRRGAWRSSQSVRGNGAHEWATLPVATLPGRAGVNPLRTTMQYVVDQEAAEQLKAIGTKLGIRMGRGAP